MPQARPLRPLGACLAALGGSTFPGGEAGPLGTRPLPRVLEPAAYQAASRAASRAAAVWVRRNKEKFEASFPADFIAEGIDQTRGWFYTLMVLSTALFDKPAFKNLICNGMT